MPCRSTKCTARLHKSVRRQNAAPAKSCICAQTETPSTLRQAQQPYSAARPPSAAQSAHPALTSNAMPTTAAGSGSTARSTAPATRKNTTHPQTERLDVTAEEMAAEAPCPPPLRGAAAAAAGGESLAAIRNILGHGEVLSHRPYRYSHKQSAPRPQIRPDLRGVQQHPQPDIIQQQPAHAADDKPRPRTAPQHLQKCRIAPGNPPRAVQLSGQPRADGVPAYPRKHNSLRGLGGLKPQHFLQGRSRK